MCLCYLLHRRLLAQRPSPSGSQSDSRLAEAHRVTTAIAADNGSHQGQAANRIALTQMVLTVVGLNRSDNLTSQRLSRGSLMAQSLLMLISNAIGVTDCAEEAMCSHQQSGILIAL